MRECAGALGLIVPFDWMSWDGVRFYQEDPPALATAPSAMPSGCSPPFSGPSDSVTATSKAPCRADSCKLPSSDHDAGRRATTGRPA